jgi:hypothetical protein
MENGTQKLGLRIAAGFLVAILIIVAVFASGVTLPSLENNPSFGSEQGRLTVLLMDAPVDVDELWINVTGVAVHKIGDDQAQTSVQESETPAEENEKGWINITLSGSNQKGVYFDLLKYRLENEGQNNVVLNLAEDDTAEGTYDKIRLTISEAYAIYYEYDEEGGIVYQTDEEDKIMLDPKTDMPIPEIAENQTLKVPPNRIDVIKKFTIEEQNPVAVLIDMQPDWIGISQSGNLRPVMKVTITTPEEILEDTQIETIETLGE